MDNIYHRHLKLPFQIQKPLYFEKTFDTPHQKTFLKGENHSNETITSWLKRIGCGIGAVECFYTPPSSSIPIHTDDLDADHVKINMTWGPEGGVTRWWRTKKIISMSDTSKASNFLKLEITQFIHLKSPRKKILKWFLKQIQIFQVC